MTGYGPLMDLPATYVATVENLLALLSISRELGHLGGGLMIYFGILAFMAPRRAGWLPLLAVILAELFNESMQAAFYGDLRMADTLGDIGWTVTLPCLIFAFAGQRDHAPARLETGPAAYPG